MNTQVSSEIVRTNPPDLLDSILAIQRELHPDALATLLYGSRASGRPRPDSDVDLYFVKPGFGELVEQRAMRDGLRFQIASVPRAVLAQLPAVSVRARRPVGLFGLAHGRLVQGELPELDALAEAARRAIASINASLRGEVEKSLRSALATAEMALASDDAAAALALKLRAVPMLLETELQWLAGDHIASRSRYRHLAGERPDLVAAYAAILRASLAGDDAPLVDALRRLRATLGEEPAALVVRAIRPEQLGLSDRPANR
jgi:hypothetical protein